MEMDAQTATYKALQTEVVMLREHKSSLEEELANLRFQFEQLRRLVFGAKSERFEPELPDQLGLFGQEAPGGPVAAPVSESTTTTSERAETKRHPVRVVFPSHLPRQTTVIEPDIDTTGLRKIGQEVTETLDFVPAKLIVVRRERPKYETPDGQVAIAELPARPIDKGIAEPRLLAHVVAAKYLDHMPLYRQAQQMARQGITIATSTLGGWVSQTADLLTPLYDELTRKARESGYVQADETPIRVQDSKKKGETHRGWYWVYHAPEKGIVIMDYHASRGRAGPAAWLGPDYDGLLQSDGYAVYNQFANATHAVCWAHARRYFHDAQESTAERAEYVLAEIQKLYAIERQLREEDAAPTERTRVRQEKATPILEGLKTYIENNPGLPKSPWGKASSYALTRWDKLTRYVLEGRLEIDNNLTENTIRPIALGRKNWLFSGSHDAAQRAAVIYSLVATCKKHGVNPETWMADVLARIPTHPAKRIEELLPMDWEKRKV